ncbi:unnamed protein product [Cuscuta europaea]|uniref:NAC domain-containing protein n=1 Tax=Cuscuta europaea TaxID=41803 RepID=A0A9P0ZH52_CUSEU|nr:unnamed protein product [Cuscuta europaea]
MMKRNSSSGGGGGGHQHPHHQMMMSSSSSDLIDAKLEEPYQQLCGGGSKLLHHCPGCGHTLQPNPEWVGLPAGVKFDPTDQELIQHLEAKVVVADKESKSGGRGHPLIDEFIPTIEGEDGICYTHPEKLPGVTRDGLSRHFFHRPSKAYTTGTRKRRKIQTECELQAGGETRWHKTGKTRPVMANGKQRGCKKILVLYTNFGKNRKPEKTNWVMHQYHLGQHEEEKEGELVVSKIFYQTQPRQCSNWSSAADRRDSAGSGSCSSSKDVNAQSQSQSHGDNNVNELSVAVGISPYDTGAAALETQPTDHHYTAAFHPFTKHDDDFHHAGGGIPVAAEAAGAGRMTVMEIQGTSRLRQCEGGQEQNTSAAAAAAALHNPPPLLYHHHPPYNVPTIILSNHNNFQQQHHHQHHNHNKLGSRRSASELEELIMGCTSSTTDHIKEGSSSIIMGNQHEAAWLKYTTPFWHDPDNPDHHG